MTSLSSPFFLPKPFSYFDHKGECSFPNPDLVRSNARQGIVTALVLDANVCLNLANFAPGQKDADKDAVSRALLQVTELGKVDVVPYFGCLDLASARGTDQLDTDQADQLRVKRCTRIGAKGGLLGVCCKVAAESGDERPKPLRLPPSSSD